MSYSAYWTLSPSKISKGFQSFLDASQDTFSDMGELLQDDPSYLVNRFQSAFIKQFQTFTIGQLLDHSALTMQRALDVARIAKIFTDTKTGLLKIGQLLEDVKVAVNPLNDSMLVVSGNHRLNALPVVLHAAGVDEQVILDTEFQVLSYTVDVEHLKELLTVDGQEPEYKVLFETAQELIHSLWIAGNQSRSMSSGEVKEGASFKLGINLSDTDQLIEAFSKDLIDAKTFFVYSTYANLASNDEHKSSVVYNDRQVTKTTMLEILTTFYGELYSMYDVVGSRTNKKGEVVEKRVKYWGKDLKNADAMADITEWFVGNVNTLIPEALDSLPMDDPMRNNVARNSAHIGQHAAESLDSVSKPSDDPRDTKPKAKKTKTKRPSLGITL